MVGPSSVRRAAQALFALIVAAALTAPPAPRASVAQQPATAPYRLEASWPLPPRDFAIDDLAVAADGSVALADQLGKRVLFYGPDGSFLRQQVLPCDTLLPSNPRLEVSPTGDRFLLLVSCLLESGSVRNVVAQHDRDGRALAPPAVLSQPLGRLRDIAGGADGRLRVLGDLRLGRVDPATGAVDQAEELGPERNAASRLASLTDGGLVLLSTDGRLQRFDSSGQELTAALPEDSRLTLVDLVPDAAGGVVALAGMKGAFVRGPDLAREDYPLLFRFDGALLQLPAERPAPLLASLPFGRAYGFGARLLHRSAGGWLIGSRLWVDEAHRLAPDGMALRVAAGSYRPQRYNRDPVDMPSPPPNMPQLPLAWVDGQPWLLDGRVTPPELFALSAAGARRLAASSLRAPYLDLAPAEGGGIWLSRPDGLDRWTASGGLEPLDLPCACPDGGRIAAFSLAGLETVFRSQPRDGRVQVIDTSLRATAGKLVLPEPAALWPSDLAVSPRGEVLTADAATGEVQRWTAGGLLRGSWLEAGPGAGPRRIAAADLDTQPDRVAILTADQRLVLRELDEGRWLGDLPLPLPDPDGYAEDLALAPDGRIALSDLGAGRLLLLAPVPEAIPSPGGAPSPTPTAVDRPCRIERDKVVGPGTVVLGHTATITLTLAADCGRPGRHVGADLVLVVENTYDRRAGADGGVIDYLARVPDVAAALTRWMDLRRHQVGLVSAQAHSEVLLPLGTPPLQIIDRLRSLGDTSPAGPQIDQLLTSAGTMLAGGRPDALPVLVLITNAASLDSPRAGPAAQAAVKLAEGLRASGVQVFAVLIPNSSQRLVGDDVAQAWLAKLTGSPQRVYLAANGAEVERLANQIYSQVRTLAGTSLAGSLTLHDAMAPDIALLPGTAAGSPLEGPDWLIWRRGLLPASGITLTYGIRPLKVGLLPTNRFAVADYTDVDGQRRSVTFPLPRILVMAPTPSPTATPPPSATAAPTATARPRPLYLPLLLQRHCLSSSGPVDVALVLDSSQSMLEQGRGGRSKLEAAREALRIFLGLLRLPSDRAALVSFSGDAALLQGLTGDRAQLDAALGRVSLGSGTRIHLGLARARSALPPPSPGRRSAILLLTDGRSDPDPASLAIAQAREARAAGVVVVAVGLGQDIDRSALVQIASPGQLYLAPDAEDLAGVYRGLAGALPCLP